MEKAESLQVTRGDFLASLENDIKPVSVHECARVGVAHSVMTVTMEEGKCPLPCASGPVVPHGFLYTLRDLTIVPQQTTDGSAFDQSFL